MSQVVRKSFSDIVLVFVADLGVLLVRGGPLLLYVLSKCYEGIVSMVKGNRVCKGG